MNQDILKKWYQAKRARVVAIDWNNLPNGKKYQNDSFKISEAHCKPPVLCRSGQQVHGGKNYWETEKEFNNAILSYLIQNWEDIYPFIMKIMEEKERKALIECQKFIDDMQSKILEAQKQKPDLLA